MITVHFKAILRINCVLDARKVLESVARKIMVIFFFFWKCF